MTRTENIRGKKIIVAVETLVTPTSIHWVSLAFAAVLIAYINKNYWFFLDEWMFLTDRAFFPKGTDLGILDGHNGHISVLPVITYRIIFKLFGVRTYVPYLAVLIAFHVALCHALWRLIRKVGVRPWTATAAIGIFAVLGAGVENLSWAFQWIFFGPLLFGTCALLIIKESGKVEKKEWLASALLVLGIITSGTGIAIVFIVTLTLLLRNRKSAIPVIVAPAAAIYLTWYVLVPVATPVTDWLLVTQPWPIAIRVMPEFVWNGLTGAASASIGLSAIGPLVSGGLFVFALRFGRPKIEPWPLVLPMAAGAILFLALVAITRSGLGVTYGASSRYVYVVVALLLPLATLCFDYLANGKPLRPLFLALITGVLILSSVTPLWGVRTGESSRIAGKKTFVAVAHLSRDGEKFLVPDVINFAGLKILTIKELEILLRNGDLPKNIDLSPADILNARISYQSAVGPKSLVEGAPPELIPQKGMLVEPDGLGCFRVTSKTSNLEMSFRFSEPGSLRFYTDLGENITLTAYQKNAKATKEIGVANKTWQFLSIAWPANKVKISFPNQSATTLCEISVMREK